MFGELFDQELGENEGSHVCGFYSPADSLCSKRKMRWWVFKKVAKSCNLCIWLRRLIEGLCWVIGKGYIWQLTRWFLRITLDAARGIASIHVGNAKKLNHACMVIPLLSHFSPSIPLMATHTSLTYPSCPLLHLVPSPNPFFLTIFSSTRLLIP